MKLRTERETFRTTASVGASSLAEQRLEEESEQQWAGLQDAAACRLRPLQLHLALVSPVDSHHSSSSSRGRPDGAVRWAGLYHLSVFPSQRSEGCSRCSRSTGSSGAPRLPGLSGASRREGPSRSRGADWSSRTERRRGNCWRRWFSRFRGSSGAPRTCWGSGFSRSGWM